MKILVTGCAGFIGSHLVERLLKDGHEVLGVDSFDPYYPRSYKEKNLLSCLLHPKFRLFEENLAEVPLSKVMKGAEAVFHLAAQPGVRGSWGALFPKYVTHNVLVTQRLLEEAKGRKIRRFVYASSSSVYGEASGALAEDRLPAPLSPYGVTKLAGEHLCALYGREAGVPAAALRLFSVYGPRQRPDMAFHKFCRALIEDTPITVLGDGRQVRDFTYVGDVVEAFVRCLERDVAGKVLNVGGGSPAALWDALKMLEGLAGREVHKQFFERARGDVTATCADTARMREVLGDLPATPLEVGLAAEWEWAQRYYEGEAAERKLKEEARGRGQEGEGTVAQDGEPQEQG